VVPLSFIIQRDGWFVKQKGSINLGKVNFVANKTTLRECLGFPDRIKLLDIHQDKDIIGHGWDLMVIEVDDPEVPEGNYKPIFIREKDGYRFSHWEKQNR
jgi:hypothetical protein